MFDPACGSGNFLVIAYKAMREIEFEINKRRGEPDRRTDIPLTNFRGIELRDFPAEIARLALIIAEYQSDVTYRGQKEAIAEFLPLGSENWITCGNALRLDWLNICPPTGTSVKVTSNDLFQTPLDQAEIDFENEGGETYICGNPPYLGSNMQSASQKAEIKELVNGRVSASGFLDYVVGWFLKATDWLCHAPGAAAFVSTNSICQGQSVPILWPLLFERGISIHFAHTSFKWSNLASNKAGVTVAIVGMKCGPTGVCRLYESDESGQLIVREGPSITPYLTLGAPIIVEKSNEPLSNLAIMEFGNKPSDGGNLLLRFEEARRLDMSKEQKDHFIRRVTGSDDFINGIVRYCIWITDEGLHEAQAIPALSSRIEAVRQIRLASPDKGANALARRSHQFKLMRIGQIRTILVPRVSSERRPYIPVGIADHTTALTDLAFGLYDAPIWNLAILSSRMHLVWIATVCGKLETRYRYSNTMGWNTLPVPRLTQGDKAELTRCAEAILLAREAHFPATIADLYDPERMPEDLARAHEANDEVLERIYIGRRFRNDTERLEKLFELYTKMTTNPAGPKKAA